MSTKSKKVDPAYPTDTYSKSGHRIEHFTGITILDTFAMSALQGLYAALPERYSDNPEYWAYWADAAYDII